MPLIALLLVGLLVLSTAWGVRRYRQCDGLEREDRLASAALPAAYTCVLAAYVGQILLMPFDDWNACRLAPTMALRYGYRLYYPPEEGPILGMLYGPFNAVTYLPVLVARTPTQALLIGGAITVLLLLCPMWLVVRGACRGSAFERRMGHVAFLFAAAALLLHASTLYIARNIHADAPAVGFGLLACAVILRAGRTPGNRQLLLAAALATFASFSKQFEATVMVALAAYLGLRFGLRPALTFLFGAALFAGVLFGCFGLLWGFDAMVQNTLRLPIRHPRREWLHVANDFYGWLKGGAAVSLIVMIGVLYGRARRATGYGLRGYGRPEPGAWRQEPAQQPVFLLLLTALFLVPTSILAVARFGAEANANHWTYYLVAAAALSLVGLSATSDGVPLGRLARRGVYCVALATVGLALPQLDHLRRAADLGTNPQQAAYEFARSHPEETYFPWQPLSTLMAEGRAYHFEYGVFDRVLVGAAPTGEHFRAFLPSKLRRVVFRGDREQVITLSRQYLPEFTRKTEVPELPGWTAYELETRQSGTAPGGTGK